MTDKLINIFAEVFDISPEKLDDNTSPDNTSQWDSLAAMHLVAALETYLNIRLSTKEIMRINSIGAARKILQEKNVAI